MDRRVINKILELRESSKPSLATAWHTKINPNKTGTIGHATHIADYSLHGRKATNDAIEALHNATNGSNKVDISRKIDGGVSLTTTKEKGKARTISYKGANAPHFKERDTQAVHAAWGPKGTTPKPHLHGLMTRLVKGRSRVKYPEGSWQGDILKQQHDRSFGGNIVSYHPRAGSHGGKEILHIPTKMHKDETTIHPKDKEEIQHHIDNARKWSSAHTDKHLVDAQGNRHKFLTDGKKDFVEHYMNSTLDTGTHATSDDFHTHVKALYDKKLEKLKDEKAKERVKKQQSEALSHIKKHQTNFDKTFAIHRELQNAQNKLTVAIGKKSHKSGRFPFRMSINHPHYGKLPSEVGEGFMVKDKASGFTGKLVGRSANGTQVKARHNFAYANRHSGRF